VSALNVLFLDQFNELGGAQRCLLETMDVLRAYGDNCFLAVPGQGPLADISMVATDHILSLPVCSLKSGKKGLFESVLYLVQSIRSAVLIYFFALDKGIDLVYANGPRTFLWTLPFCISRRVDVIWHLHLILRTRQSKLLLRFIPAPRTVIAVSQAAQRSLPRGRLASRSRVVYNGVKDYIPANSTMSRIGVVGRLHPVKGQIDVLRAFSQLAMERDEISLFVIGSPMFSDVAAHAYLEEMMAYCAANHIAHRVIFTGQVADAIALIRTLDVLVQPSREPDALPRTILEAMANGVPVVAARTGGIPEMVIDEYNGLLFEPGDIEQLVNAMRRCLDPHVRQGFVARSYELLERDFSQEQYNIKILGIIHG